MKVPILAIAAERKGNSLKSFLKPVIKLMPFKLRSFLIGMEVKSNIHKARPERKVSFISDITPYKDKKIAKILLIDDSVDTGYSILQVRNLVLESFPSSDIRIASLNVWDKSETVIHTDYAKYRNTIIKAPMSKDSSEYDKFIALYNKSINNNHLHN